MMRRPVIQRASQVFLWLVPIEFPLFIIPRLRGLLYQPGRLLPLFVFAAIQASLMGAAAWILGVHAPGREEAERQPLFAAAALLGSAWVVIGVLVPMGPPIQGPTYFDFPLDPYLRHSALIVAGLLAFGGLAVLTAALLKAGDRVLSMLGFAASIIFIINRIPQQALSATGLGRVIFTNSAMPADLGPRLVEFILFTDAIGLACGYLATGLYAAALPKLGLGKTGCRVLAGISFGAAALFVVAAIGGLVLHLPRNSPWMIGGALGIPGFQIMLPYFMGVMLLRRVGDAGDVVKSTGAA